MTIEKWVEMINSIPHCYAGSIEECSDCGDILISGSFSMNQYEEDHEDSGLLYFYQNNQAGFGTMEKTIFSGDWNSVYLELKHYIEKLWVIPEIVPLD